MFTLLAWAYEFPIVVILAAYYDHHQGVPRRYVGSKEAKLTPSTRCGAFEMVTPASDMKVRPIIRPLSLAQVHNLLSDMFEQQYPAVVIFDEAARHYEFLSPPEEQPAPAKLVWAATQQVLKKRCVTFRMAAEAQHEVAQEAAESKAEEVAAPAPATRAPAAPGAEETTIKVEVSRNDKKRRERMERRANKEDDDTGARSQKKRKKESEDGNSTSTGADSKRKNSEVGSSSTSSGAGKKRTTNK